MPRTALSPVPRTYPRLRQVAVAVVLRGRADIDWKNPNAKEDITLLPPEQLAASILEKEQPIAKITGIFASCSPNNGMTAPCPRFFGLAGLEKTGGSNPPLPVREIPLAAAPKLALFLRQHTRHASTGHRKETGKRTRAGASFLRVSHEV